MVLPHKVGFLHCTALTHLLSECLYKAYYMLILRNKWKKKSRGNKLLVAKQIDM